MPHPIYLDAVGVPLHPFVLGTMTFADTVDEATARSIVDEALDSGVTGVDTANVYAAGEGERMVGRALAGRRDRVVLATKAGLPHSDIGDDAPLSAAALRRCLTGSLSRLQVEAVDIFYLHQPDRCTPLSETLEAVATLHQEGKLRALGVSNYAAWQIGQIDRLAADIGCPRPVVAQQVFNLVARRLEDEYAEYALTSGIATLVFNPLAGGLLTGAHRFEDRPSGGRFGASAVAPTYQQRYWQPQMFDAVQRLSKVASAAGLSLVDLALRWLLNRPVVCGILLGFSTREHFRANLDALAAGPLPVDVVEACDEATQPLRPAMPAYNR
ncbi:MAG TPA: aldo/keto reductase [Acidothermaceae bacterium]|jgi:aryl-alcohol dehydrogenase-like predicted oxidoreductase